MPIVLNAIFFPQVYLLSPFFFTLLHCAPITSHVTSTMGHGYNMLGRMWKRLHGSNVKPFRPKTRERHNKREQNSRTKLFNKMKESNHLGSYVLMVWACYGSTNYSYYYALVFVVSMMSQLLFSWCLCVANPQCQMGLGIILEDKTTFFIVQFEKKSSKL